MQGKYVIMYTLMFLLGILLTALHSPAHPEVITNITADAGAEMVLDADPDDRITVFFSTIGEQVQANVELNRRGVRFGWVIDRAHDEAGLPVYIDIQGPIIEKAKGGHLSKGDPARVRTGAVVIIHW